MSMGVKGFRIGTGPRGNYVHMGAGGLYYRASLGNGGSRTQRTALPDAPGLPTPASQPIAGQSPIEIGSISEMFPSNGSDIVEQINQKLATPRFWLWCLCGGLFAGVLMAGQPDNANLAVPVICVTLILAGALWWWDQSYRAVVIMYDLADEVTAPFRTLSEQILAIGTAQRIWNIDTAGHTDDWKRNAGAGKLITRKQATVSYGAPGVVRTNLSSPCIVGGRHNLYFLPDVVLIIEGNRAGALAYEQLEISWNTTVFIEDESVPSDSQIVGYTWRFVNKNGGPDRRFNNNRQLPKALYQQMGIQGAGKLQKILQLSKVDARDGFNSALDAMRATVRQLNIKALAPPRTAPEPSAPQPPVATPASTPDLNQDENQDAESSTLKVGFAGIFGATVIVGLLLLWAAGYFTSAPQPSPESQPVAVSQTPKVLPSFDCTSVTSPVLLLVCSTPGLAAADQEMAAAYQAAQTTPVDAALRRSQRNWLMTRDNSVADVSILAELYKGRISFLQHYHRATALGRSRKPKVVDQTAPPAGQTQPNALHACTHEELVQARIARMNQYTNSPNCSNGL